MINWIVRYRPIVEELDRRRMSRVLEVGSGSEGLSMFWCGRVTGVDVAFGRRPMHTPVAASAIALPFGDGSWPGVVNCDMLEHVPPAFRRQAVEELARVSSDVLIVAFPSGEAARSCYAELARLHRARVPQWLREHLAHPLPDANEVVDWLVRQSWAVDVGWHESAAAHYRTMRFERHLPCRLLTYGVLRMAGRALVRRWPVSDASPCVRAVLVCQRQGVRQNGAQNGGGCPTGVIP